MNITDLKKWIVATFWSAEQVAGWASAQFFRRAVHRQTSNGAPSAGLPVVLNDAGVLDSSFITTLVQPALTLKQSSAPTPTAEGDIQWDTDGNFLVIGDGAKQKIFYPTVESTYTPTIHGTGSDPTVAYTFREASYRKHGNWCEVTVYIQINTISGGTGLVQILLPFTAVNARRARSVGALHTSNVEWTTGSMVVARVSENTARCALVYMADNATSGNIAVADLADGDIINFSVSYPTQ